MQKTLQWVHEVLLNRAYLDGTRYYKTGECFLFFMSRLLQCSEDPELHSLLKPLLKSRVQEHIGKEGDALALAMRIIVCDYVGVRNDVDLRALLPLQCEDGGWEIGWIYGYGSSGIKIGNRGLTTALAIKAITSMSHRPSTSPTPTLVEPIQATTESRPGHVKPQANSDTLSTAKVANRDRRNSFKESLQWLMHVGRPRKSVQLQGSI